MNKYYYVIIGLLAVNIAIYSNDVNAEVCWKAPTHREDNKILPVNEINGYKMYYGVIQDKPDHQLSINDGGATCYNLQVDEFSYGVMTTIDTGGRESTFSNEFTVNGSGETPIEVKIPSQITNFMYERVAGTLDYVFVWDNPITFTNGDPLPEGAITKHFLIVNGKWVKDVNNAATSVTWPLKLGENTVMIETEIKVDGNVSVSGRTVPVMINVVDVVVSRPMPPEVWVN